MNNSKISNWLLELQEFQPFSILYREGTSGVMGLADLCSRLLDVSKPYKALSTFHIHHYHHSITNPRGRTGSQIDCVSAGKRSDLTAMKTQDRQQAGRGRPELLALGDNKNALPSFGQVWGTSMGARQIKS